MRRLMLHTVGTVVVTFSVLFVTPADLTAQTSGQAAPQGIQRPMPQGARTALLFARTELFFGTAKPDGTVVTDAQFNEFLDRVVTPRFPDGLTVLKGDGQFRLSSGEIIKEDSFVLILLYPLDSFALSSRRINTIRERYKTQFQQQSVLRADDFFPSRISF